MAASAELRVRRGTALAVQVMTMSAWASSLSRSSSPTAWALSSPASACARLKVRLAITKRLTPALMKWRAVSPQIRVLPPAQTDRGGRDRHRVLADPGLRSHALGGRKGCLEQLIERRSG